MILTVNKTVLVAAEILFGKADNYLCRGQVGIECSRLERDLTVS